MNLYSRIKKTTRHITKYPKLEALNIFILAGGCCNTYTKFSLGFSFLNSKNSIRLLSLYNSNILFFILFVYMAITIIDKPFTSTHNFAAGHNPCFLTVSGSNNTQTGYKHIYDIFINGTLEARIKKAPMPNGYGAIDIHRVVENYISHDIEYADTGFLHSTNMRAAVTVQIGEEYGTTQNLNVVSQQIRVWNASIPYRTFITFDTTTVLPNYNASARFLTTPTSFRQVRGSYAWLHMIQEATDDIAYLYVRTFNASGAGVGTYKLTNANIQLVDKQKLIHANYYNATTIYKAFWINLDTISGLNRNISTGGDYFIYNGLKYKVVGVENEFDTDWVLVICAQGVVSDD